MPSLDRSFVEAVVELGRRALTGAELNSLFMQAVELVTDCLVVEFSSVLELLPDGRTLFQAGVGWKDEVVANAAVEMSGESVGGHVLRTVAPLAIADLRKERGFVVSPLFRDHNVVSTVSVPLYGRNRALGVLGAHSLRPRHFSASEIAWLQLIANVLSSRLEEKWRRLSEQDQQFRGEQMMAMGQVAAGVVHELRNPLTSVKGLIQVNLRDLQSLGFPIEDLSVIEQEIRRMERTLQTFLDFAKPPKSDRRLLALSDIVERVFALVSGRARDQKVAMRLVEPGSPVRAEVEEDQVQQLVLNLVLNSLDAMPSGGTLLVELRSSVNGFVELFFRDTGTGIAAHILPKVFEPFVSSKDTGIGLGLPLSQRIAEEHGGTLSVHSAQCKGACFLLRLPAI
jgi:signal transduction histidine kinase